MLASLVPGYLTRASCCESPCFHFCADAAKRVLFASQADRSVRDFERDLQRAESLNRLTKAGNSCTAERWT